MTVLNGDKIERLLWSSGVDFFYDTPSYTSIHLRFSVEPYDLHVHDAWEDGNDWWLDSDQLHLVVSRDGETVEETYESVVDEQGFVDMILRYAEK